MGRRTQSLIGTMNGVATVYVDSANPKTADGCNTFIFRRDVEKSLRKLTWLPVVDGTLNRLPPDIVAGDEGVRYDREQKKAITRFAVECAKSQYGAVDNNDFGAFDINSTFASEVQRHAIGTRRELVSILSARKIAEKMVHIAGSPNEEISMKRPIKFFEYGLAKLRLDDGVYLALGMVGIGANSRRYYDQHIAAKFKVDSEVTSLQGQSRIGESTFDAVYDNRFRLILQGVELCWMQKNGHIAYNAKNARAFLSRWLADKHDIVLVTGRASYAACGAEAFFAPFLEGKRVTHMTTVGENARAEDIEGKRRSLPVKVDAYIAVGGGTVIDTTKLLRGIEGELPPFLAVPTTAGTGAEATRFAVYYDHGVKKSADDARYLPTDQVLIPEFAATQTTYQKACTEFDAYAQAVESSWAVGATDESREYARKALALMAKGEQMLGAYWAGRAIDISRTTAAHALSYYMTANYGIPHGHAVYMMFPFVCRANGRPEFIREVVELESLKGFASRNNIDWNELVDALLANVNPQRLANNPGLITKEVFDV